jgi:hypothetical protein
MATLIAQKNGAKVIYSAEFSKESTIDYALEHFASGSG